MTRRLNEVINRAEVAKAAVLALPKMPKASLAKSLGIFSRTIDLLSIGTV